MTDFDIVKQIEKELDVRLSKSIFEGEAESVSPNYVLNQNGQITSLGLYKCKIKNLNYIISPLKELKNLTVLYLSNNQLRDISPLKVLKK